MQHQELGNIVRMSDKKPFVCLVLPKNSRTVLSHFAERDNKGNKVCYVIFMLLPNNNQQTTCIILNDGVFSFLSTPATITVQAKAATTNEQAIIVSLYMIASVFLWSLFIKRNVY